MLPLRELQRAFLRAVASGDPAATIASAVEGVVTEVRDCGPLSARERVQIYARMYGTRLVDALAEDYPRVVAVLGWDRFHEVAHAYVAEHPSRHPSLRWFGERFAGFLATTAASRDPTFVADLARLEWARVMVFDAPDVELLSVESLRQHPPESWAQLRLRAVPALEVMRVGWPVHEIWEAAAKGEPAAWRPAERWLRVWRQGDRVFQVPMDVPERIALAHVQAGDDFGSLCAGLATVMTGDEAGVVAGALVLRWIEDELLCGTDVTRS